MVLGDRDLAVALAFAQTWEKRLREEFKTDDQAERDQMLNALRLIVPFGRSIQTWIGLRALRAQLHINE